MSNGVNGAVKRFDDAAVEAVAITDDVLAKNGQAIRVALQAAYGGELNADLTNLLFGQLAKHELHGWCLVGQEDRSKKLLGLLLARVIDDPILGRHLYLPALQVQARVPARRYRELFREVEAFARRQGCHWVVYQSDQAGALKLGEACGFERLSVVMRREVKFDG